MLFHITHTHPPELCPARDPKLVRMTWGKALKSVKEVGIELKAAYGDTPAHTLYLIVESDTVEKIEKFLFPVFSIGTAKVSPVTDAMETVKRFS